jgi:hypothetical protein
VPINSIIAGLNFTLSCPASCRASTSFFAAKTWMAGTSPAMTIELTPHTAHVHLIKRNRDFERDQRHDQHLQPPLAGFERSVAYQAAG